MIKIESLEEELKEIAKPLSDKNNSFTSYEELSSINTNDETVLCNNNSIMSDKT